MSCFLRSNGPTTLNLVTDIVIYNSTSALVVLEEMIRETLQTLACLSVLTSTYSLHMSTRDSYRNPLVDHMNLAQFNEPNGQQQTSATQSQQSKHNTASSSQDLLLDDNEIPDYNGVIIQPPPPPPPMGSVLQPRSLQELFGSATKYDIRVQQQQHERSGGEPPLPPLSKTAPPAYSPNKRTPNTSGALGAGVSSGGAIMFPTMSHGIASQLMLRSARGQRQYDVPQIGKYSLTRSVACISNIPFETKRFYKVPAVSDFHKTI